MPVVMKWTRAALGLALLAALAACAAEPVQECEPGVGEISEMGTVCPPV